MSTAHRIQVDPTGHVVLPADVRGRLGWEEGTTLIAVEEGLPQAGLLLVSTDTALEAVRSQLAGHDLVSELLAERRAAAAQDVAG